MRTQSVEYFDNDVVLEGYLAYEESTGGPRPAVLVAHDWSGRNEFACRKAEELAKLGYVGFALDMYGKGILGKNNEEKAQLIQPFMQDRSKLQQRMQAALQTVQQQSVVNKQKIAAIGFCFGGLCILDLARSGADISGAVSFHGLLNAPGNTRTKISAKVLALHGHDDPMVPPEQVADFTREMTAAQADWQIHIYGNTLHAFTNPLAKDPAFGTVYDARADKRSWQATQNFLAEIFT